MMNKLHGQPESYEKKYESQPRGEGTTEKYDRRSKYHLLKTLGAGTYGIVREADGPQGKCAVKIILKKNVRGNEQMVYDEMAMLQKMKHKHIVKFHEWFESKVCIIEDVGGCMLIFAG